MGSKIEPYFILTAEKVTDPKELKDIIKQEDSHIQCKIPTTPPTSGVSRQTSQYFNQKNRQTNLKTKKCFVKYKIPIKEFRKKQSLNKKMELIKEKLEKSRERFKEQKRSNEEVYLSCEPTSSNTGKSISSNRIKFHRSSTDITETNLPYTYFVVSDENNAKIAAGKTVSKSADKRRRLRSVEEKRLKLEKNEGQKHFLKKIGIATDLGLKSNIILKTDSQNENKPFINQIVFEGPENQPQPKCQYTTGSKVVRTSYSPPRIPPCTPATILTIHSGENKAEQSAVESDENVPRKPFLSGPLYTGKNHGTHAFSLQHFELPNITPEQKRRALGLGTKFEEFAYPKPQSEQRQRNVSFSNPLPSVKGTGLIVSYNDIKENIGFEIPSLGPRAVTMGSIILPSERLDKQSICQKYLAGDNMSSKRMKKVGVPLSLPKIDIVSNVYDDMIIKMIKEYLQDTNSQSRQSQLAKELLAHLQKHNERMKELSVPQLNRKQQKSKITKEDAMKSHHKTQQLLNNINFFAPPNTAEDTEPKVMSPSMKAFDSLESGQTDEPKSDEKDEKRQVKSADNPRSIPYVQITFKTKDKETDPEFSGYLLPKENTMLSDDRQSLKTNEKKSNIRPILSVVAPVSFQMAPPGLSKDDSFVTVPSKAPVFI